MSKWGLVCAFCKKRAPDPPTLLEKCTCGSAQFISERKMDGMNILLSGIERSGVKLVRADLLDLPGSPPVGEGRTEAEAVADLFRRVIADKSTNWLTYVQVEFPAVITRDA